MWRTVLAVLLLPSLKGAQTAVPPLTPIPSAPVPTTETPYVTAKSYHSYSGLRRGAEETVAIMVEPLGYVVSPRSPVPGGVPIALELQPSAGLAFGPIDYPKPFKHKFAFQKERIPAFEFPDQHMEIPLRAAPDAALGLHTVTGKFTFQTVTDAGVLAPQQVEIQFHVTVVEHSAEVMRSKHFPSQDRIPAWDDMSLGAKIILVPLFPILFVVSQLVCAARGEDCSC